MKNKHVGLFTSRVVTAMLVMALAAGGLLSGSAPVNAVASSMTVTASALTLNTDTDENGYANIGDVLLVSVDYTNNEGCATTHATADLTKYGIPVLSLSTCVAMGPGSYRLLGSGTIIDSGASGVDTAIDNVASAVVITLTDSDEPVGITTTTNALGDGVIDTATLYGVDSIALQIVGNETYALKQDGTATSTPTHMWYFYPGQNLRFAVETDDVADTEVNDALACVQSISQSNMTAVCDPIEFYTGTVGADVLPSASQLNGVIEFNNPLTDIVALPTAPGGYPINIMIVDNAGNETFSTTSTQQLIGVFGVNPADMVPALNDPGTTDWSTITDFTAVTNLAFSHVAAGEDGSISLNGPINLTDSATLDGLIALGNNMMIVGGDATGTAAVGLDSSALSALNTPAHIAITVPDNGVQPGFVVYDDDGVTPTGEVVPMNCGTDCDGGTHFFANIDWSNAPTLEFDTNDGFSFFGFDSTAPTITSSVPTNGGNSSGLTQKITVNFDEAMDTGSCLVAMVPDPGSVSVFSWPTDSQMVIAHAALTLNTSYNVNLTSCADVVGNALGDQTITFTAKNSSSGAVNASVSSFTINNNAASTASTSVTLNMLINYCTEMMISNSGSFTGAVWEPCATSKPWTLTSGAGTKTVYGKFRSSSGVEVTTSDSIELTGTTVTPPTPPGDTTTPPPTSPTGGSYAQNEGDNGSYMAGRWVKVSTHPAVYFVDSLNQRHAYPTQAVWESYFGHDFSRVVVISATELASMSLGRNVPFNNGSLVKMPSVVKVYVVSNNGELRWVASEALAAKYFGGAWASRVHDLSEAFFSDYTVGTSITE